MLPAEWNQPGRTALSPRAGRAAAYSFEPERDGMRGMLTGSTALHIATAAAILAWGWWLSAHRGDMWGGQAVQSGAIEATLVTKAPSIPIPSPQTPTDSVLATDNPSPAPAPPAPAVKEAEAPPDAIPIPNKKAPPKEQPKSKPAPEQPKATAVAPPQPKPITKPLPIPKPSNRVPYGEAPPANIPRSAPNASAANSPVAVGGDFGQRFAWYVDIIKRKAGQNWYRAEVDPRTGAGTRVFLTFDIARDGTPSHVRVEKSSGSPTLDTSGIRALQRVDTFGPLPPGYNGGTLSVEYFFEY